MKFHFPSLFSLRSVHLFASSHADMILGIFSQAGLYIFGYLFLALLPVMLSFYFGGEQTAGILMSLFTAVQVFIFTPLGGKLMERYSLIGLFKFSLFIEMIGALLWFFLPGKWGIVCFALAVLFRMAVLATDPLILRLAEKEKGGFWFGLRDEISAFAVYAGLMIFPFFILPHSWEYFPLLILGIDIIMMGVIFQIRNQIPPRAENKDTSSSDILSPLKKGLEFIKQNHNYPLFYVGSLVFEGLFYGGIWFLFPLYIVDTALLSSGSEYTLGIYELVTVFCALFCGIIADRFSWKRIEFFAWAITIVLAWAICFYTSVYFLILLGFFIGLANNFFSAAGYHALAEFNTDQKNEKSFTMLGRIIMNSGYMVSPLVCGVLYQSYGFVPAMMFIAVCVSRIGVWMMWLLWNTKK